MKLDSATGRLTCIPTNTIGIRDNASIFWDFNALTTGHGLRIETDSSLTIGSIISIFALHLDGGNAVEMWLASANMAADTYGLRVRDTTKVIDAFSTFYDDSADIWVSGSNAAGTLLQTYYGTDHIAAAPAVADGCFWFEKDGIPAQYYLAAMMGGNKLRVELE